MMGSISAWSKASAAIGTQVCAAISYSYVDDPAKGDQVAFLIGSAFAALGAIIVYFVIPDVSRRLEDDDADWKVYLADHGWEATWGDSVTVDPKGVIMNRATIRLPIRCKICDKGYWPGIAIPKPTPSHTHFSPCVLSREPVAKGLCTCMVAMYKDRGVTESAYRWTGAKPRVIGEKRRIHVFGTCAWIRRSRSSPASRQQASW
jgi:hypothetical protein